MNHTLWVLIITIALFKTTIQTNGETPKKTCKTWLNDDKYTDGDYEANKKRAEEILTNKDLSTTNIWTITYSKTINYLSEMSKKNVYLFKNEEWVAVDQYEKKSTYNMTSKDYLFPNNFCELVNQDEEKKTENMTPKVTQKTCPEWIELIGYGEDKLENIALAKQQKKVAQFVSSCANSYIIYLLHLELLQAYLTPSIFCHQVRKVIPGTLQNFDDCGTPISFERVLYNSGHTLTKIVY